MSMKNNTHQKVASYIKANPDSSNSEICEALFMDPSGVYLHLNTLFNAGILTRRRDCRKYRYSVVPGMYIESDKAHIPTKKSIPRAEEIESLAMELIERGLHRRAATVLTEAIGLVKTEREVQRVSRLRHQCLMSAKRQHHGAQA
ncbi:helix-turn-helix domain-containing protein [Enterobacter kobei]|uniref:helix-turn-helix domain-containing protein n=1 Tax=Enterobacter kobei TaxID=208224 RepID=UPI002A7FA291|nr:helix-turn-helix domain-containing protein [Enterobacter kobei]